MTAFFEDFTKLLSVFLQQPKIQMLFYSKTGGEVFICSENIEIIVYCCLNICILFPLFCPLYSTSRIISSSFKFFYRHACSVIS